MSDAGGLSAFTESMRALHESCQRAVEALRQFEINMAYLCNEDLRNWNDEMDNCYPNIEWPDS